MRRADRLFQIVQILQRQKTTITAGHMAAELEVSERTIYRDIQDLMSNNVPIEGERGVGYILREGYDLPPLMFTEEEIDAIMLGVRLVEVKSDPELSRAAKDVLAKIENVLPPDRRSLLQSVRYIVPQFAAPPSIAINMRKLRAAIRNLQKIEMQYQDVSGTMTTRVIWPLLTVLFDPVQLLVGWCELRQGFRNFRIDRISSFLTLDQHFHHAKKQELKAYLENQKQVDKE
ncbi:MAG: DNA-binding transcriptional regulator [Sneathiella sp.]|nr:MAG: DNA-binding transcriptional regulator [Sneathiella sp.]